MSLPKSVYRYRLVSEFSLAELANRSIWFSSVQDFNDPFEFRLRLKDFDDTPENRKYARELLSIATGLTDSEVEAIMKAQDWEEYRDSMKGALESGVNLKEKIKSKGVCCFSSRIDSVLMWGHYADGHKGFAVEYDTSYEPFSYLLPVTYEAQIPAFSIQEFTKEMPTLLKDVVTIKSNDWAYEQEFRLVHKDGHNRMSERINPKSIKRIIFGSRCSKENKTLIARLVVDLDVELVQAELSATEFGFTFTGLEFDPQPFIENSEN